MKKFLLISFILIVIIGMLVAEKPNHTFQTLTPEHSVSTMSRRNPELLRNSADNQRQESIVYKQDFNDGWQGWSTLDITSAQAMWHLTQFNAYGGEGYSWWMADPEIGGYRNSQYTYLDTPEITVTEDDTLLTFNINWSVEALGDHEINGEFYDGWDGVNVRISTDDGNTWSVISGLPEYNSESMFSFGRIHGEGPNVPGWGGTSNGWVDATFDLSDYIGDDVRIRFAFASDAAVDSESNPELLSVFVDNISLGDFDEDFDDGEAAGMTYGSLVPEGGDLWHIGQPTPLPPSPPNAAICQNEQGTYNPNMINYLISPPIQLPPAGDIRVDFDMTGGVLDNSAHWPNCNFWGFEISIDDGESWYYMSNPYGDEDGNNYVYINIPEIWWSATQAYPGLSGDISGHAGETVKFRILFHTNDDQPDGPGLMIDNFAVYHDQYLPAPSNLYAEESDGMVHLSWDPPGLGGKEGWIHWDSGINYDGIGLNLSPGETAAFDVAARFLPTDLEPYFGGHITEVKFFSNQIEGTTFILTVWTGRDGDVIAYQDTLSTTDIEVEAWNEIVLEDPVKIEIGQQYWIGYTVIQPAEVFPAGIDPGPHVADKGDMIRIGPVWTSLYTASEGAIDGNWNIQALVENLDGQRSTITRNNQRLEIDLDGYNIYRSVVSGEEYEFVGNIDDPEITIFSDTEPVEGTINYYIVKGRYDVSESLPTNEASVFVMRASSTEIVYDDGEVDFGYNAGNGNHAAVMFEDETGDSFFLTHIKVYVETKRTGAYVMKVWDEDNGSVGQLRSQFVYPSTLIQEGWNIIPIPAANPVEFADQNFFIGIQEVANSSTIGVDENNVGSSFIKIGTDPWEDYDDGNFMIRAIVDPDFVSIEDLEELPSLQELTATNYPNPFNPETKIVFNLPQDDNVRLTVYNLKGQRISTLVDDVLNKGNHSVVWDGKNNYGNDIPSGVYLYRIETSNEAVTRRMVLLK